jgi:hypothetical protein
MGKIPVVLNQHILDAYPDNVCLVATHQPDGYCRAEACTSTIRIP